MRSNERRVGSALRVRSGSRSQFGPRAQAIAAAIIVLAALCSCRAPESRPLTEDAQTASATGERAMSSLELIDAAVMSGALQYSTGMLYKVYVMFEPENLPAEFASDVPAKCGTPLISEVQRNWNLLSPNDQAEISRYIQPLGRPDDDETQLDDVSPDRLEHEREKLD